MARSALRATATRQDVQKEFSRLFARREVSPPAGVITLRVTAAGAQIIPPEPKQPDALSGARAAFLAELCTNLLFAAAKERDLTLELLLFTEKEVGELPASGTFLRYSPEWFALRARKRDSTESYPILFGPDFVLTQTETKGIGGYSNSRYPENPRPGFFEMTLDYLAFKAPGSSDTSKLPPFDLEMY